MNPDDTPELYSVRVCACDNCGDVVECCFRPDPYSDELAGDDTPMWLCDVCYLNSCDDI